MIATTVSPAASAVRRWMAFNPTGEEFTAADFGALLDAARTDPRIDADEVLSIGVECYGPALYSEAPWACPLCRGCGYVPHRRTSHLHPHDPNNADVIDAPCPECQPDECGEWAAA